ncbi:MULTISPECIES: S41 family peptidase [Cobetia]|uniref:S41 family peptidase n=1 Tax=Cobetia crustatorum TaxID=553385 RepID=A0A558HS74_9GAMM|nr:MULTISPECIES: S41 family peptidase [Cobetia]TVU71980.1 S41 family peptidase [Cobetia crustatorum]
MPASSSFHPAPRRLRQLAVSVPLSLALLGGGLPAVAEEMPRETAPTQAEGLPLDELRTFAEVFERIKRTYVDEVDDRTLLKNAMRGMLEGLDPHSSYLDQQDWQDLRENTDGEFGGIGIEVGMEDDGKLTIIAPIDDTPASRAGLQPRDVILKIDNTPLDGLPMSEAVKLMRGDAGSRIRLLILSEGADMPREVVLERAIIKSSSVTHRLLDPGYGYLRISQFQSATGDEARTALAQLRKDNDATSLKGLVLDLRNNPGGLLSAAVEISDLFLSNGRIVYTQGRLPDSELSFSAKADTPADDIPLIVLINGGTASAAEIVSGALQDQRRAIIMGTDSFGKGSVQTVMPLGNGDGLKLTTALYFTPSGRSIQAEGIQPDVEVVRGRLERDTRRDFSVREADLDGRLDNANGESEAVQSKAPTSPVVAESDYQLGEALNLLKGMNVLDRSAALEAVAPATPDQ